ncbi:MAG: response regulator [Deltaproteobacteria bacterium]|nr:response regulator [Deltaproteobacteria bacterium]
MKILIAEDDLTSRLILENFLQEYGTTNVVVNGTEAVSAVRSALKDGQPYDLICLDIMMPEMDGVKALEKIRKSEEGRGITSTYGAKIIMITALDDPKNVMDSFKELCDAYIVKPIDKTMLLQKLDEIGLARIGQ